MQLTTKGRYAVTAMLDLALQEGSGPVRLADISGRQGISLSYLEQLFALLRRNDLVSSLRGPGGGYRLSRASGEISVAEVITAVKEPMDATRCGGKGNCSNGEMCITHHLWMDLSEQLYSFLSSISLGDLVKRHRDAEAAKAAEENAETSEPDSQIDSDLIPDSENLLVRSGENV